VVLSEKGETSKEHDILKDEPQLCPECPLRMLLPDIKRRSWTQEPEKPSNVQLCRRLRAEARKWPGLSCPYYKNESLLFFIPHKAKTAWIHRAIVNDISHALGLRY
jgi:hypothetical protein